MLRSESHARTALWPYGGVPYDQGRRWLGQYRQDCSGFVSMCWGLPMDAPGSWGGYSTVTLVSQGLIFEIPPDSLKLGDAIGICGPDSDGNNGHIMYFEAWYNQNPNDNRCWIWEQAGGVSGPRRRLINYPGFPYKSWRWKGIQDDVTAFLRRPWPSYMNPSVDYFGDINGPNESHGGYYSYEQPDVKAIQQRMIAMGFVPNVGNIFSAWADGIYGPETIAAVSRWQHALYANLTTLYGQVWSDDWSRLFTY